MKSDEKIKLLRLKANLKRNTFQKFLRNIFDYQILQQLETLINKAYQLGLAENYIEDAIVNIEYNEFQISFEELVERMYEYEIKIDKEFYDLSMSICETLKLEKHRYDFLKELLT